MTDDERDLEIAKEAPTDEEGHPVHPDPDKSHRICAATKSDRTTPTDHGRERNDVEYCLLAAGWGVDDVHEGPCRKHTGAVDNRGDEHWNFKTGAFSEYFTSHLTDVEQDAFDEAREMLDEPEDAKEVAKSAASICLIKFRRSGDERFLRRFESICDKFGIAPADELELSGSVGIEEAWKTSAQDDDDEEDVDPEDDTETGES